MKKFVSNVALSALLALPAVGLAQPSTLPAIDVMQALDDMTNWLFAILLIVAVIYVIIAAYHFITAQGDPDKVKLARNMVLYSLIGVAVAIASKGLVVLVRRVMRG